MSTTATVVMVIILAALLVLFITSTKIEEAIFGSRLGNTAERETLLILCCRWL